MDHLLAQRTLFTNSFKHFVKWAWDFVTPFKLIWGSHLDALCTHLQAIRDGKITNLLVNLPPRHSKSIVCTVLWPVWMWLSNPAEAFLSASYAQELSTKHAGLSRRLIESAEFKKLFPWVQLEDGSNSQATFSTTAGGTFKAVSVGSGTTGHNSTITIVDDLHTIKKKESEAERRAAIDYYRNDLSSRDVIGQTQRTVVVGQRVHAEDVSGFVIDNFRDNPSWSFLILPMEFDPERETLPNAIGFRDWRDERGAILFPESVTPEIVASKKTLHRNDYACLFNQDVVNLAGDIFKAEWFRHYSSCNGKYVLGDRVIRPESCSRVATVDIAVGTASGNDWTVCVVADLIGADVIVRHVHRERLDGVRFVPTLLGIYQTYKPAFLAVEQAGQQKIYIDQLRAAGVPVRGIKVTQDKETRSIPFQIRMESGNVWFPAGATWFPELQSELLAFPRGRFDDQVDALSMLGNLGRYAASVVEELTDEEREKRAEEAQAKHFQEMMLAGIS